MYISTGSLILIVALIVYYINNHKTPAQQRRHTEAKCRLMRIKEQQQRRLPLCKEVLEYLFPTLDLETARAVYAKYYTEERRAERVAIRNRVQLEADAYDRAHSRIGMGMDIPSMIILHVTYVLAGLIIVGYFLGLLG